MTRMTMTSIIRAANLLKAGKLVAFPTETVYGLGGDATNEEAIARIFSAKKRPKTHPLIVHLAHVNQLSSWTSSVTEDVLKLANAFWPGPLTMVLPKQPWVLKEVTGGQDTVGLRIPKHPVAQALLNEFNGGIAAPSANQFTHVSPTTAKAVEEELGDCIDVILDGGASEIGLESTIIDLSNEHPRLLRPGMITVMQLEACLEKSIQLATSNNDIRAPGMHELHYAPNTKTLLFSNDEIKASLQSNIPLALITHDASWFQISPAVRLFSLSHDPFSYAHDLYHTLRHADQLNVSSIIIQKVPDAPIWDAIRDRIQKASGKRS